MSRFRPIDCDVDFLLPPSVQEWLPEGHLARDIVEVIEGLDLSELEREYGGRGRDAYHPATPTTPGWPPTGGASPRNSRRCSCRSCRSRGRTSSAASAP